MNFENYTTKAAEAIQGMLDLAARKSHQEIQILTLQIVPISETLDFRCHPSLCIPSQIMVLVI